MCSLGTAVLLVVVVVVGGPAVAVAADECDGWRGKMQQNPSCIATVNLAVCLMRASRCATPTARPGLAHLPD